ncbi:MAG TPA: hypothetical protein VHM91_06960, partial [Verrucomicrobiales bacterium]|nr:hypothetical protein [Verrucomicrobiales bacterium]
SRQQQNPMMPQAGVEQASTLSRLLPVWGYSFDTTKIVADPSYGMPLGQNLVNPTILMLGPEAVGDNDDELTKDLTSFFSVYAGGFSGSPASGLKETVFLKTSDRHGMVATTYADANPQGAEAVKHAQELTYKLQSEGKARLIALRLQGKFKTAFPEGKPPPPKKEDKPARGGMPPGMQGLNFGEQGAQGETGTPAEPGKNEPAPAAPPAAPAPAPATPAATEPAKPATATTPPVSATTPPVSATTPPVSITPPASGTPAPAPATPPAAPAPTGTPAPAPVTPPVPAPLPVTPPAPTGTPAPNTPLLPPPAGTPATPAAPDANTLKEATAEGIVYLVGDSDMIADLGPNGNSANFALAMRMVDQAAGDRDLLSVRGRGAATRPFSTLKQIIQDANQKIQKDVQTWQADVQAAQDEIKKITDRKDRIQASIVARKELQTKIEKLNKQIYQAQKDAKKEYDGVIFNIKWKNVFLPPLIIALAGLAVYIIRRFKTAAH